MENSIDHIITRILSGNSSSEDFLSLSEWLNAENILLEVYTKEQKRISVAKELLGCGSLVQPFLNA